MRVLSEDERLRERARDYARQYRRRDADGRAEYDARTARSSMNIHTWFGDFGI